MKDPKQKWNERYRTAGPAMAMPCTALQDFAHLLPASGRALDLACGLGGNALFLAERGLHTHAIDLSDQALTSLAATASARNLPIETHCVDLEKEDLPVGPHDVIVVAHYLQRSLAPALMRSLSQGGLLYYQTYTRLAPPGGGGPSNPEWRLASGELLRMFAGLQPVAYREEGLHGDAGEGLRGRAYLIATKP